MVTYVQEGSARVRAAQPATGAQQTLAQFNVTNPTENDVDFILHSFDSALPYLASIGSQAQWGTKPFSEKPDVVSHFTKYVRDSYELQANPAKGGPGWHDMLLYEVKTPEGQWTRVAALGISVGFPDYVPEALAGRQTRDATDFVYLKYLVTDRRAASLAKGSATQLMTVAEQQARDMGKSVCYGDCWRGNGDGLLK